jgi:hypothetical protein
MSTRRRKAPDGDFAFSLLDEIRASPEHPMPAAKREDEMRAAQSHLANLAYGAVPTRQNWKVLTTVGNLFQTMLTFGLVKDEDGLLEHAKAVLYSASQHAAKHGVPLRLVGAEVAIMENLLLAYDEVLQALPHRDFVRVCRETDKRMRVQRPGDYDANPAKSKGHEASD